MFNGDASSFYVITFLLQLPLTLTQGLSRFFVISLLASSLYSHAAADRCVRERARRHVAPDDGGNIFYRKVDCARVCVCVCTTHCVASKHDSTRDSSSAN